MTQRRSILRRGAMFGVAALMFGWAMSPLRAAEVAQEQGSSGGTNEAVDHWDVSEEGDWHLAVQLQEAILSLRLDQTAPAAELRRRDEIVAQITQMADPTAQRDLLELLETHERLQGSEIP